MNGKQLKNSILQWAIQGKLVPQDPNDEPASVLLEKIRTEKARLIKEGKIKKDKNESFIFRGDDNSYYEKFLTTGEIKCIDEEIPFEIPKGWEWCRLRQITSLLGDGIHGTPEYNPNGEYYFVNGNNLQDKKIVIKPDTKKVSREEYLKYKKNLNKHTVLVSINGTLGNIGFYNDEPIMLGKSACYFNLIIEDLKEYVYILLQSPFFMGYTLKAATGTTIKNVSLMAMNNLLIPLPPLCEQNRIVDRMTILDTKVKQYQKQETCLRELNNNIYSILKKSILQDAIQGKLVPQIAEEGTAEELLERIRQEKLRLVKESKLKKSALTDSVIYKGDDNKYYERIGHKSIDITDEILFDLPDNWSWVRFGHYIKMSIGKTPPRGETKYWANGKYSWVSISDMADYGLVKTTKETVTEYAKCLFGDISPLGTLIMSFKLTVGRTSLLDIPAYHNEAIISIYPFVDKDCSTRNYLFYILPIISSLGDSKDAIKGKTLNSKSLNNLLLPLPPLNEQKRIVAMIEQLFDKLK
ncbi:restriction endonuclease subunit S [Bacteroides zhangwenhongii]|uniref:restriction endonuclease subunit S n=1 Tax=Bacteroides zhangwenhongii TaxID=2650157 RepID=UPI003AAD3204